jgi:hypothetical protein
MFAVFPAADLRSSLDELTLLFFYFLLLNCLPTAFQSQPLAVLGSGAGGEAQSKHKEGFDPLKCSLCVKRNWLRYGAGPSLRTVA